MKNYSLRSRSRASFMTVLDETEDSFLVRLDGTTDFISKDFFDNCLRTGYLSKIPAEGKREDREDREAFAASA